MIAVAAVAVLVSVTAAGACIGAAVIARHRAQSVADLAALAAAARVAGGAAAACGQAATITQPAGTRVVACEVEGLDVVVTVEAAAGVGVWGPARAAARAGPAEDGG